MDDYGNRWINGWLWWWWQQWCVDGRSLWTKKLARPSRRKSLPRSILVAPQHTPAWPRAPESRNATRRGESPRQGGCRGAEKPGNRPAQGSPPQEPEAPQEEPPPAPGDGAKPSRNRDRTHKSPGHRLAAHSAGRPQIGARRQPRTAPLNAHPEPRTREPAARNPLASPQPTPTPNLSRRRLASAFLLRTCTNWNPDRGNSHQARHTQQVGSPNSHTRPKTGWGKALSRPLVTPRAGRDGVDGCSPLAGKGADATGLLAVRDPAMLGTPPDGDQSQGGRTRSDCLSTRGTARV